MRRISARWIPHLLTKEQKLARVRISKQFLKQFPEYNNRFLQISSWAKRRGFTFMSPSEKYVTKYGQPKTLRSIRTMSVKKVMHVIFFTNQDLSIQVAVSKGKSVNAKFYKVKILHKLKKNNSKTVNKQMVSVM
jgi:histone-lysine N-methyltransferase SETMAR